MKDLLNIDGGLMSFLSRIADLLILNVLFVITCIPIITIGPSLTAMYSITLKMAKNEESYIFKNYFKAFKENFKISLLSWLILLAAFAFIYVDYKLSGLFTETIRSLFTVFFLVIFLVVFIVTLYLFPYIARFENTLKNSFRNSLMISIASLPYTIILLVITTAIIGISAFVIELQHSILVWLFFGFALLAFIQSFILRRVFAKYEPTDDSPTDSSNIEDASA